MCNTWLRLAMLTRASTISDWISLTYHHHQPQVTLHSLLCHTVVNILQSRQKPNFTKEKNINACLVETYWLMKSRLGVVLWFVVDVEIYLKRLNFHNFSFTCKVFPLEAEPPPQPSVGLYCDDEHLESSRNSNGQHSLGQPSLADDRSFVKYFLILLLAFDAYGRSSSFLPQPSIVNFIYHFFHVLFKIFINVKPVTQDHF